MADTLFQPLEFKNLKIKNRIFRSNVAGRFDNYDGSGNQARINWELKFARGGVGGIMSSFVPVAARGRIMPNYATIESDDRIPFWRELGKRVHEHDCRFIMQLSHAGRQRDMPGIEFAKGLSSTAKPEPLHGFECERMTVKDIQARVQAFAAGARRARAAGLDGVELHGANGYLITQFLSSANNDRRDDYGGSLRKRARFLLEIVAAIRKEAGASEDSLDLDGMKRVEDWILDLRPPEFPRNRIDSARAAKGKVLFDLHCASCHTPPGQTVDIAAIGTDPERLLSFTPELAVKMNTIGNGKPWKFSHFRKTNGYASMPLDGIWLRAPYLHNGSVPTLRDLLNAPDQRPAVFWRGYDVYDFDNVGFVSSGAKAESSGFRFDTSVRGNGRQGHTYGSSMREAEKIELLEYLKTL